MSGTGTSRRDRVHFDTAPPSGGSKRDLQGYAGKPAGLPYQTGAVSICTRRDRAGFTLIELMVVITIIGIMTALMIPEMKGSFQDALLRSTGRELINTFDLAYSRAVSLNQTRRVRLDETTGRYAVEKEVEGNGPEVFVPADDVPGNKGQLDPRITVEFHAPDEFSTDDSTATAEPGPQNNNSGETTIAFYPDGTADAGNILLRDRQGYRLLLEINPVTARVHVVEMQPEAHP